MLQVINDEFIEIRKGSMIPALLNDKKLISELEDMVLSGKQWNDLTEDDMETLSGYCLFAMGSDAYEYLMESGDIDTVIHKIAKAMVSGKRDEDIEEILKNEAVKYFSPYINELFQQVYDWIQHDKNDDAGLVASNDPQTGEIIWKRG